MNTNPYWSLKIQQLPSELEDEMSAWLFENAASGVHQDLSFSQTDKRYLPEVQDEKFIDLIAYFESPVSDELLAQLTKSFPGVSPVVEQKQSLDWQEEWKKNWRPFCLVDRFWVVPSWLVEDFQRPQVEKIIIDPGMAFGTGTHATTQLASQMICEAAKWGPFASVVDVGTGSGILAILMEKLSWPSVVAYDNDEHAERVFLENVQRNNCQAIRWQPNWHQDSFYDCIVANIIDGVLLDLKPYFQKCLPVGGHLILTGILQERKSEFLQQMLGGWDLELVGSSSREEWVGLHLRRRR